MKKLIQLTILCIIVSLLVVTTATAQENSERIYKKLRPKTESVKVFDEVIYEKDKKSVHVRIKGSKKADGVTKAYHVELNPQKGTYKTTKIPSKEMSILKNPSSTEKDTDNIIEPKSTINYYGWVQTVTDDPAGEDLCKTKLWLEWEDYGSTIGFDTHALVTWAANPSSFDTHWYEEDSNLYDPYLYYNDEKLSQEGSAEYYNWDFIDDDEKTEVSHWIQITAQNDGTYDYVTDWGARGEYQLLLDLDVYTN
ncbi:MAG: hypothetical protein K9L17_07225 [Clostridiales bacterium]|nr:hypothetical protein [Clostridiales bacterium]MCF8022463.1 hypothetical protein [Clostridiales bacterium]